MAHGTANRNRAVHTIGNLTLVNKRLNSSLSNGPWIEKRKALADHSVMFLSKRLVHDGPEIWDEYAIEARAKWARGARPTPDDPRGHRPSTATAGTACVARNTSSGSRFSISSSRSGSVICSRMSSYDLIAISGTAKNQELATQSSTS